MLNGMHPLAKTLAREVARNTPFLQDRYFEWEFRRREQSFRGIYPSFSAAVLASPTGKLVGYDHKEVVTIDEEATTHLNPADYPVLFWMASLLPETKTVFDLGGNIGVAYYVYRRYLNFPEDLRWLVCEVPQTVAAAREYAQSRGEDRLRFTTEREAAESSDIYFTSGALQYIEDPFADIIGRLQNKPRHILINRVPLCAGPPFITLQNNGTWVVPYQIANEAEFIASIVALGYDLVDHWRIHRSLQVLTSPEHFVENYQGMYFRKSV
jgi:putative methyltransferase (TIGR04325 family)